MRLAAPALAVLVLCAPASAKSPDYLHRAEATPIARQEIHEFIAGDRDPYRIVRVRRMGPQKLRYYFTTPLPEEVGIGEDTMQADIMGGVEVYARSGQVKARRLPTADIVDPRRYRSDC